MKFVHGTDLWLLYFLSIIEQLLQTEGSFNVESMLLAFAIVVISVSYHANIASYLQRKISAFYGGENIMTTNLFHDVL